MKVSLPAAGQSPVILVLPLTVPQGASPLKEHWPLRPETIWFWAVQLTSPDL